MRDRGNSMKKRNMIIILSALVIMIIAIGTTDKYARTIDKSVKNSRQILYKKETGKGTVVFYEPANHPNSVNVALVKRNLLGFYWGFGSGTAPFDSKESITYSYSNIGESCEEGNPNAFPIINGIIMDENIQIVKIQLKEGTNIKADIVETNLGRIWYTFLDNQINYTPKITGIGRDNQILFTNYN